MKVKVHRNSQPYLPLVCVPRSALLRTLTAWANGFFLTSPMMNETLLTNAHSRAIHGNTYSDDVKRAAVERVANGESGRIVAREIGCAYGTLLRWRSGKSSHPTKSYDCQRCAELAAALRLLLASLDTPPTMRAQVRTMVEQVLADAGK